MSLVKRYVTDEKMKCWSFAKYHKKFPEIKCNNLNKIQALTVQITPYRLESHDKFLINYTNIQLTNNVGSILSAGLNFSIPCRTKDIPIPTILKKLEYCILKLNIGENNKTIIRAQTTNIIKNFCLNKSNGSNQFNSVSKDFIRTKKFLNGDADLLLMRSDKGGSTVVKRRDEYMTDMLKDEES